MSILFPSSQAQGSATPQEASSAQGAVSLPRDLQSDTWVATDALGRPTPDYRDCPLRKDKTVGMFYFLWSGAHGTDGPYDITQLLAAHPDNPQYGPRHAFHWWGEPEAGYFLSTDPWVIRRNLSMLADAGVDVLILDVTNGPTYTETYMELARIAMTMRANGEHTPQFCFITWSSSPDVVTQLYHDLYARKLFPELWFRWQGKPLILGKPDDKRHDGTNLPEEIRSFFTWRTAWFEPAGYQAGKDQWTWGSTSPQHAAWHIEGVPEEVSVSAATHPTSNIGRSFHNGAEPPHDLYAKTPETPKGHFFQEQWERALQLDPEFIFVTGWNEWQAMRFLVGVPGKADDSLDSPVGEFLGKPTKPGDSYFVDQYNQEYSRDIEPMKDGHTDDFYYQLVHYIRRFKGVRPPTPPTRQKSIRIHGDFAQWDNVGPEYLDTIGDTLHRDYKGWGTLHYTDTTGRNDFVRMKVARDARYITFYAETKDPITPYSDPNWMLLFLDSDQNHATGWEGYDYLINYGGVTEKTTTLKRNTGGWHWETVCELPYKVSGNKLMIQVPRSAIGQTGKEVALDFHWADNIGDSGNIREFFLHGDSAPNRRFNYRYGPVTTVSARKATSTGK